MTLHRGQPGGGCRPHELWADSGGGDALGSACVVHGHEGRPCLGRPGLRPAALAAATSAAHVHARAHLALEHRGRSRSCNPPFFAPLRLWSPSSPNRLLGCSLSHPLSLSPSLPLCLSPPPSLSLKPLTKFVNVRHACHTHGT